MTNPLTAYLRLFRDIADEDAIIIEAAWKEKDYQEGERLFKEDKICKELFFVCNGVLRIATINDEGKEITHFFINENRFCSILNSFNNKTIANESILAACDATVMSITRQALDNLYLKLPYLEPLVTQITYQVLLDKIATTNAYLGQDSTARYKTFMIKQPDIALRVSQNQIASYLHITPQSLSRIRRSIK